MADAGELGYQIVISEETVEKIACYKADLKLGNAKAGKYLGEQISNVDLNIISVYDFIELLLSTKKPLIFAEQEVKCDGTDWSSREFAILGDVNVAVKALAYDNGMWNAKLCTKYNRPLEVELLFTPGAILSIRNEFKYNPDYKEVVENYEVNQEKYIALVERRLLPLLTYVNKQAENDKKAFIVLPGIGCGCFAGHFRGQMEGKLANALEVILGKHTFPNIKSIHLGFYEDQLNIIKEINGIIYEVRGNSLPQLSHPREYNTDFRDCKLYKAVAWDHASLPGNDFFGNNTRYTDDGVSAAATNLVEVITGVKGTYKKGKYIPPDEYKDWEAVAKVYNVKLAANKNNVKVVSRDGRYVDHLM